jgi:hypothetical protein
MFYLIFGFFDHSKLVLLQPCLKVDRFLPGLIGFDSG